MYRILNIPLPISLNRPIILKFNLKVFWMTTLVLMALLLAFYIFQINELARARYLIENYEKKINIISEQSKKLEISLTQKNSLKNLEALVQSLNFEPVEKVYYIKVLESSVVVK